MHLLTYLLYVLCLSDISISCPKTDEPIEMIFGVWTRVGPRNHVLGGGPHVPAGREILGPIQKYRGKLSLATLRGR